MTRLLIAAGAHGSAGHVQQFDRRPPDGLTPIVWRRSFPHGGQWPDAESMIYLLRHRDYAVRAIVTVRDWLPACMSQVHAGHVTSQAQADQNMRQAYLRIFEALAVTDTPYIMVTLAGLRAYADDLIPFIRRWAGLRAQVAHEPISDPDQKWWRAETMKQ